MSNDMISYWSTKGITYHLTIPNSPSNNPIAERFNRTICEKARSLLFKSKLSDTFWGDAVLHATELIKLLPCKALNENKTPYEKWHGKKTEIKFLRVFGSTVFLHTESPAGKFSSRCSMGILVGLVPNGYKIQNVQKHKYEHARNVAFDDETFTLTRPKRDANNESTDPDDWTVDNINRTDFYPKNRNEGVNEGQVVKTSSNGMIETAIGSDLGVVVCPNVGGNSVINEIDSTPRQELGNDKECNDKKE